MMAYLVTEMAEAQAIGVCLLSRSRGLPQVSSLRSAVAVFHTNPDGTDRKCDWCDYPSDQLRGFIVPLGVDRASEKAWWRMPGKARLAAIEAALRPALTSAEEQGKI